ncbi:MAG TPA: DnaB-like helicase N-terminal domain-containing protein, partial [bacterium]|nr:DnaB-like helicase N-terminal domain-containing protein [bacterium]
MIRDPEAIIRVRDILQPHDFHQPSHQIIYQSILDITNRGSSVDLMILHDDLERKKQVDHAGGLLYLTEIVHGVATSVNIEYHAAIVLEKSQRRQLIRHCSEITEKAQAGE